MSDCCPCKGDFVFSVYYARVSLSYYHIIIFVILSYYFFVILSLKKKITDWYVIIFTLQNMKQQLNLCDSKVVLLSDDTAVKTGISFPHNFDRQTQFLFLYKVVTTVSNVRNCFVMARECLCQFYALARRILAYLCFAKACQQVWLSTWTIISMLKECNNGTKTPW